MKFDEYLQCAQKHLRGCEALLESYHSDTKGDIHVWLELYYLSGYIIEGITVYSVYKVNGWEQKDDIQKKYDLEFTKRTKLDFYVKRTYKKNGQEMIPHYFQNRPAGSFSVQQHKFQEIVKSLLRSNPAQPTNPVGELY